MSTQLLRKYINLILEQQDLEDHYQWVDRGIDEDGVEEADHTDELDFSPDDTFDEVIEKVMSNEDNRIGIGKYRQGWHHPFDKRLVIKVATPRDENTIEECAERNMWEFMVWHKCKSENLPELKFLMPCYDIHPDGLWMTQRKGTRIKKDQSIPIKGDMEWVGDRSKTNYANLGDEVKSIDYGTTKAMEHLGLPMEYDKCHKIVNQILKALNKPVNDPDYGKSEPHDDPLNPTKPTEE